MKRRLAARAIVANVVFGDSASFLTIASAHSCLVELTGSHKSRPALAICARIGGETARNGRDLKKLHVKKVVPWLCVTLCESRGGTIGSWRINLGRWWWL